MPSFDTITGPKADRWLVKTVGALLGVVEAVMLMAGIRGQRSLELGILGMGTAAVLGTVDVTYVARGRISPMYLADGLIEALLLVAGAIAWRHNDERS